MGRGVVNANQKTGRRKGVRVVGEPPRGSKKPRAACRAASGPRLLHHDWTISQLRTAASAASGGCASYRLSLERQGRPAAFAPWPLWSGCRWLCRSRPALSVTTRWGLRLLRTRATSAGGVLLLTHARAGAGIEAESSALSSWSPAAQGGAVAAERVGVEFRESRFFFSATGSSFSEVRASSST